MEAARQSAERDGQERPVVIADHVLMALDYLDSAERAAVRQALQELRHLPPGEPADARLRRVPVDEPIYMLRAAPRVELFVQLTPGGLVELVELVRPETLRQFSIPAATTARA